MEANNQEVKQNENNEYEYTLEDGTVFKWSTKIEPRARSGHVGVRQITFHFTLEEVAKIQAMLKSTTIKKNVLEDEIVAHFGVPRPKVEKKPKAKSDSVPVVEINDELLKEIKNARTHKVTYDSIREQLLNAGFDKLTIDTHFIAVGDNAKPVIPKLF